MADAIRKAATARVVVTAALRGARYPKLAKSVSALRVFDA